MRQIPVLIPADDVGFREVEAGSKGGEVVDDGVGEVGTRGCWALQRLLAFLDWK